MAVSARGKLVVGGLLGGHIDIEHLPADRIPQGDVADLR